MRMTKERRRKKNREQKLPGRDLPDFDGLVTGGGDDGISRGMEDHAGDIVIMAVEGLDADIIILEVPQLYRQISRAGGQEDPL